MAFNQTPTFLFQTWFQNRRSKFRKEANKNNTQSSSNPSLQVQYMQMQQHALNSANARTHNPSFQQCHQPNPVSSSTSRNIQFDGYQPQSQAHDQYAAYYGYRMNNA